MREVKTGDKTKGVYLPHHAVVRDDKSTTKVRVVFDASCKYEYNISLNEILMVGPTLQSDLRHIVTRWRIHPICIVADIVKMYRQVRVAEEHITFQRIVWRDEPEDEIKDYELITVTFGTASAPYLAVKTLHQVAIDEGKNYPLAAELIPNSFYMDDLMTGCSIVQDGEVLYREMSDLLNKGGFELQKWNTNNKDLLKVFQKGENKRNNREEKYVGKGETTGDKEEKNKVEENIENKKEKDIFDTTKILGLTWSPSDDIFKYSVHLPPKSASVTKRNILSDIAKLYDPLGWIAPTVILAKILIQRLWLTGMQWDDEVPTVLQQKWHTYRNELTKLTEVRIPRWLGITRNDVSVELHGFSDASKSAYAAVIYTRSVSSTGEISVSLLVAKTKVAPIKQISIPRLELCGALLLARLLAETARALNISKESVQAWTDSTVVLAWLNSHPSRWKTFVANRVSEILTTLDSDQWAHVSSKDNPADCASRGIQPGSLADCSQWFEGPQFLRSKNIVYNRPKNTDITLEECIKSHVTIEKLESPWSKFSSLNRLLRVVAYCKRFISKEKSNRTKYLKKIEIDQALKCCIKECQKREFKEEYTQLTKIGYIKDKTSKIKSLCPYLDDDDIIRVSGRLQHSALPDNTKHPIVLPHDDHLTKLIVASAHSRTLHGGPQLMLNFLRSAYWIVRAKSLVKQHVHNCVTCVRYNAKVTNQLMGSLPSVRCTPSRPFIHSGVDYAGPINIKTTKGRGHRAYKGYICVFVCMSTRAVHLEVASDMSTQAFLAAFRRFVSRRGHCNQVWSDNGTNFVGAARELKELSAIQSQISEHLENLGTEWHFIPPHAPNFGGIWERVVRSTKFHLRRVIGESTLTYEELSTFLTQVEACLNSRPMTVISGDDYDVPVPLTPGHFLIGGPLVGVPDNDYQLSQISFLNRWQLVQRML
ncbi:uncharacterized protein LOC131842884 [Achroia grisella]|uniref:uncharacterized protein LOC131842884 n=1 Tax=Achroia grisella TaxID=688607 RepID=UPI0027D20EBE|nr:uncharacterized protein LOC131842884 [Achroia grisella]